MISHIFRSVVVSAILLLAMWFGSIWAYDREKMTDALGWRWAELHDEAIFAWTFDRPKDIGDGNDLKEFTWADGALSGDQEDPYFFLNLEGRDIEAARFWQMHLRLWSEDENALRLFHKQMRDDQIHSSELVPLEEGWQTVTLSLPSLDWEVRSLSQPSEPAMESSWGGDAGVVTSLRIDPVENGAFKIDWVELSDEGQRPERVGSVEHFRGLDDPLFDRMQEQPGRTWHLAREGWLRTPETASWTRGEVAAMFPSAIVFPRPPTAEELEYPPFDMVSASAFLPACVFIAALLFLVVRDQVVPPWRSVVSVLALFALVEAYLYWMPHLGEVGRILLAVPVLGAVWELTPKVTPSYLPGDRRAWILVAPILVASVLVLLLKPYQGFSEYSAAEELGRYLLWALFQQFVVAVLIMSRLGAVFGRIGIVLSAGVFGLFHFPNFAMMAGAFLLGLVLLHIYDRHQNLLAIAAAQAFVAVSFNNLAMQYDWLSRTIGPEFVAGL